MVDNDVDKFSREIVPLEDIGYTSNRTMFVKFWNRFKYKSNQFWLKLPKLSDDKLTVRFILFMCCIGIMIMFISLNYYVIPHYFTHKVVTPPKEYFEYSNLETVYVTPIPKVNTLVILPNPSVLPTPKPSVTPKPTVTITATPNHYYNGGNNGESVKPYDGSDIREITASDMHFIYINNLALNVYNATYLGYAAYHGGDRALIKLNIFNAMTDETVTNLKLYVTVKSGSVILLNHKLISDENVNINPKTNYLQSANIDIPNIKGHYTIEIYVDGNDKSGFGFSREVDIL